jgi:formylglycine-generating enzyme required for sulfatase activity
MSPPLLPTWTDAPGANENLPMNCVDWYDVFAFCAWDGGRLPTEAEWNSAAAGGGDQRDYPWGNTTPDGTYAVYCPATPCTFNVLTVGSKSPKGDGKWGQADLAGGMYEWNLDAWATAYSNPCSDCANLPLGSAEVLRGGSWFYDASHMLSSDHTLSEAPSYRGDSVGARCAR